MLDSIYVVFSSCFQLSVCLRELYRQYITLMGEKNKQKTPGRVGSLLKLKSFILIAF